LFSLGFYYRRKLKHSSSGGGWGGAGIGTREKGAGGVREEGKEEVESGRNILKIHNSS